MNQHRLIPVIMIVCLGCTERSPRRGEPSLEQASLDFVNDSIAFRKIPQEEGTVLLTPYAFDSTWHVDGMFEGYRLLVRPISDTLSTPPQDKLSLRATPEMDDSIRLEGLRLWSDYNQQIGHRTAQKLLVPALMNEGDLKLFLSRKDPHELFLLVGRELRTDQTRYVEITVMRHIDNEVRRMRIQFYYDLDGKSRWWWLN